MDEVLGTHSRKTSDFAESRTAFCRVPGWPMGALLARIMAMETTSLADAKNRLSELVNAVQGTWERVTITKNGRPAAVLIAPEDLESLVETLEILSDPEAMAAIREAEASSGELTTGAEMAAIMARRLGRGAA
jgi:prevent-host-death family protein